MFPEKVADWHYPQKVKIANYPTPLTLHADLSRDLGVNFYIKHEYMADPLGGIKIRPIEYLIQSALEQGLSGFVMDAVLQSNSATALAVNVKKFNLELELLIRDEKPDTLEGNHKIMVESGARISYIPEHTWDTAKLLKEKIRIERLAQGKPVMIVPPGASDKTTVWGTVDLAYEIGHFESHHFIGFDHIVLAVGSGGNYSGLEIGRRLQAKPWKVTAVRIEDLNLPIDAEYQVMRYYDDKFAELATYVSEQLEITEDIRAEPLNFYHHAIGCGYAMFDNADLAEIKRIRNRYGVYFCPTYVYKAFRGLRELIELGEIEKYSNVLFIHTGGMTEPAEPGHNWGR